MKKFTGFLIVSFTLIVSAIVWAANFSGHASLNGLQAIRIFTAPITGTNPYFINGTLTLPSLAQGSSANSQAAVDVFKNNTVRLYHGVSGAKGFSLRAVALASGDVIKVAISSSAAVDQGLNVVKGDVFFGNGL